MLKYVKENSERHERFKKLNEIPINEKNLNLTRD